MAKDFVNSWGATHTDSHVVLRDLAANPVPHLDLETIYAGYTPESDRSTSASVKHAHRNELIAEILGADEILISSPM